MKKYSGASKIIRKIKKHRIKIDNKKYKYKFGKIFYRENGIININIYFKTKTNIEYCNITLDVVDKHVSLHNCTNDYNYGAKGIWKAMNGGIYKKAGFPDFPPVNHTTPSATPVPTVDVFPTIPPEVKDELDEPIIPTRPPVSTDSPTLTAPSNISSL